MPDQKLVISEIWVGTAWLDIYERSGYDVTVSERKRQGIVPEIDRTRALAKVQWASVSSLFFSKMDVAKSS